MNKYIKLLNHLYENTTDEYLDIMPYLLTEFPKDNQSFQVRQLLADLEGSNFVRIPSTDYNFLGAEVGEFKTEPGPKPVTLRMLYNRYDHLGKGDKYKILANITYKGINELHDYRVSSSVRSTNRLTKMSLIASALIALGVALMQCQSNMRESEKVELEKRRYKGETAEQIQQLQFDKTIDQKIIILLFSLINERDSLSKGGSIK